MTTTGPSLYDRRALVTVDGDGQRIEIPGGPGGFRMSFRARLTAKRADNEMTIEFYNLSPELRAALKKGAIVTLAAGYAETMGTIFSGDILHAETRRSGPDLITTADVADGAARRAGAVVSTTFKPGTSIQDQTAALLRAAKGDQGFKAQIKSKIAGGAAEGKSIFGTVQDELAALVEPDGYEVSSQAGTLQITRAGRPTDDPAILLSAATGLAGTPSALEDKGRAKILALLQPGLFPRRAVELDTIGFEGEDTAAAGLYVLDTVDIQGDTHGAPWAATLEATPLER